MMAALPLLSVRWRESERVCIYTCVFTFHVGMWVGCSTFFSRTPVSMALMRMFDVSDVCQMCFFFFLSLASTCIFTVCVCAHVWCWGFYLTHVFTPSYTQTLTFRFFQLIHKTCTISLSLYPPFPFFEFLMSLSCSVCVFCLSGPSTSLNKSLWFCSSGRLPPPSPVRLVSVNCFLFPHVSLVIVQK